MVLKLHRGMEKLHSGWLTKSPPEYKTHGPWKLLKSQWRRRYFVLYSPPASTIIPGSCKAILEYFENEKMARKKGSINLEKCEQIFVNLDSEFYQHIFVMQTVDRERNRTYYLAADSDVEMNYWVKLLCEIVGLHNEIQAVSTPVRNPSADSDKLRLVNRHVTPWIDSSSTSSPSLNSSIKSPPLNSSVCSPPISICSPASHGEVFESPPNFHNDDYLPLEECSSGLPANTTPSSTSRTTSIKVVRMPARQSSLAKQSETSNSRSSQASDYYNTEKGASVYVGRTSLSGVSEDAAEDDDVYNTPRIHYDRDSDVYKVPANWNRESTGSNTDYDYPPNSSNIFDDGDQDTYSDKFERILSESERHNTSVIYDELPTTPSRPVYVNNLAHQKKLHKPHAAPAPKTDDIYDVPPPMSAPKPHGQAKLHQYVNAPASNLPTSSNNTPPLPHKRGSAGTGEAYAPMSNSNRNTAINSQPRTATPTDSRTKPNLISMESGYSDEDVMSPGTRRFNKGAPMLSPDDDEIRLPVKKSTQSDDASSSSDEEEDGEGVYQIPTKEQVPLPTKEQVPLPTKEQVPLPTKEQYLELDLEFAPEDDNSRASRISMFSSVQPDRTEYKEIDYEKTRALTDTRVDREMQRKSSDNLDC